MGLTFIASQFGILQKLYFSDALILALALIAVMAGTVMGVAQWFLLRGSIPRTWIPASFAGYASGFVVAYVLYSIPLHNDIEIVSGFAGRVGIFQWVTIRHSIPHSGWWVPINLLVLPTSIVVGTLIGRQLGPLYEQIFGIIVIGVVYTVIIGVIVMWLLRRREIIRLSPLA